MTVKTTKKNHVNVLQLDTKWVASHTLSENENLLMFIFQIHFFLLLQQPKPVVRQQSQQSGYRSQQQNAYRSPDEINISLQQRRPYFAQTTPRYDDEDEYSYEK